MALAQQQIRQLYRQRAGNYDISANLYYLIGFREAHYRKQAVKALELKRGDTVVEIGCGTGLNFGYLLDAVGPTGRVIGIDLTDAMLEQARQRMARHGWRNVSLTQTDAADYAFPRGVQGVLATFALTLVPAFAQVIARAADALAPQGRMVVLDLKQPRQWPLWAVKLGAWITRPFGVTLDLAQRRPWIAMQNAFPELRMQEYFGGFVYLAAGVKAVAAARFDAGSSHMQSIDVSIQGVLLDYAAAGIIAQRLAMQAAGETLLLAWFDAKQNAGHPEVQECTGTKPGWLAYAEGHGGNLAVNINRGEFIFVFVTGLEGQGGGDGA